MNKFLILLDKLFHLEDKIIEKPNTKEDYVAEYHKIKDTPTMKGIRVCLMQDGGYKIVNTGIPIFALYTMQTTEKDGIVNSRHVTVSKAKACEKCVYYYRSKRKHDRENTVLKAI